MVVAARFSASVVVLMDAAIRREIVNKEQKYFDIMKQTFCELIDYFCDVC